MAEKICIHQASERYSAALERFRIDADIIARNRQLILEFLHDCEMGKTIRNSQKKKIGPARCHKYLIALKMISAWLGKPFDNVSQKEMERLVRDIEGNKHRTNQGRAYGDETKADFKKVIKKFYKWLQGNNDHYPELVSWIETIVKPKEVSALTREEVERMIEQSSSLRDKALIKILFDSGARAEEFLNIRLQHLTKKDDFYMIRIEHSKTKPRTISVPMATKELENWLAVHPDARNPDAQLFPMTYGAVRMLLSRIGRRVLKKRVYPHLLRHSSATYYCNKLNPYQLCYRYGWSMASAQPARYIDREGIHEQQTAVILKSDKIGVLQHENEEMKEEMCRLKERMEKSEARNRFVNKLMNLLVEKRGASEVAKEMVAAGLKEEFEERY